MTLLTIDDLGLAQLLGKRAKTSKTARMLSGALVSIEDDLSTFLGMIRVHHTAFTDHSIQHSWRIIDKLDQALSDEAKGKLTSVELFALITAAALHDSGMVGDIGEDSARLRETHHVRSREFVKKYLPERYPALSESSISRLADHIGFVVEAHGLTWDEMTSRREFDLVDKVDRQLVRPSILAILLRVGDLLDLEQERSCTLLRTELPNSFEGAETEAHHNRHKLVGRNLITPKEIAIEVSTEKLQEYHIWSDWFGYLREDIERANTYVFKDELASFRLPPPNLKILKSKDATFEVWPLRLELDETGRLWDVISKSIYTDPYDFVRELLQNSIDATLLNIFRSHDELSCSPRSWPISESGSAVVVGVHPSQSKLIVVDNGVGMNRHGLENFLFRVAACGTDDQITKTGRSFPAIAAFGIGFTSVLTRAKTISLRTRAADDESKDALEVRLQEGLRDAYVEKAVRVPQGTSIWIHANFTLSAVTLCSYIKRMFAYPSVPILFVDIGHLSEVITENRNSQGEDLNSLTEIVNALENEANEVNSDTIMQAARRLLQRSDQKRGNREFHAYQRLGVPSHALHLVESSPLPVLDVKDPIYFNLSVDRALGFNEQDAVTADQIKILKNRRKRRLSGEEAVLLWVSVNISDMEAGIEWSSLHGFLVTGSGVATQIVESPNGFVRADDYDMAVDGDLDLTWDQGWNVNVFGDQVPGTPLESRAIRALTLRLGKTTLEYSRSFIPDLSEYVEDHRGSFFELDNTLYDVRNDHGLVNVLNVLDDSVFQDGIRIMGSAHEIAPIGACAARLNLTAAARLHLNVTRNSIDQKESLLQQWFDNFGSQIQNQVLDALVHALDRMQVCWPDLITEPHDEPTDSALLTCSKASLRKLAIERSLKQ